jgi:hypothetical protein
VKIYYPNALNSIVKKLAFAPKASRVTDVFALDQHGANNPLARLFARWDGNPTMLTKRLRVVFGV